MPKSLQDQSEFNTSKIRNLKNIFFFATILAVYVRVWMSVSVWGGAEKLCATPTKMAHACLHFRHFCALRPNGYGL